MHIFDLDGTLIDSNGIWAEVDKTFLARRGLPYTREYYEGVAHTIFPLAAEFTKRHCGLSESVDEIMSEWLELAKDSYRHVPLKPHVREYLGALSARGERTAVFTSCIPAHCRTALSVHGLDRCFEQVIFAQELGMDKSSPTIFFKAAELLGVSPEECVFFDDSIRSCRSAKAAGMTVIGVYDPFFEESADEMPLVCDRFIRDFGEML